MNRGMGLTVATACVVVTLCGQAIAQQPPPPLGELKALGRERFQIGQIVVDKPARSFTVPGRVLMLDKPIEYLATSPGGVKGYETLLEVDATGSEFNLACILIGLERDPDLLKPRSSPMTTLPGPRVAISVAWSQEGKRRQVSAAEAMLNPEAGVKPAAVEWVYTGSPALDGQGRLGADVRGTLVGFKPDASNVIQSALGIGIGAYGSVRGNAVLPPVGTAIELIVDAAPAKK